MRDDQSMMQFDSFRLCIVLGWLERAFFVSLLVNLSRTSCLCDFIPTRKPNIIFARNWSFLWIIVTVIQTTHHLCVSVLCPCWQPSCNAIEWHLDRYLLPFSNQDLTAIELKFWLLTGVLRRHWVEKRPCWRHQKFSVCFWTVAAKRIRLKRVPDSPPPFNTIVVVDRKRCQKSHCWWELPFDLGSLFKE